MTETLESIPRQYKVIQHVREKFTYRDCDKISQTPAPFSGPSAAVSCPGLAGRGGWAWTRWTGARGWLDA